MPPAACVTRSRRVVPAACLALVTAVLGFAQAPGPVPAAAVTPAGVVSATSPADAPTGAFVPVVPTRVLDTRSGVGVLPGRPASGDSVTVPLLGAAGLPADGVTGVVLNLTVTAPRHEGYVQALPAGQGTPGSSSNVNVTAPDQTVANLVAVPLGLGGAVTIYDQAGAHLIADVLGYFSAASTSRGGRFESATPSRLLDTRDGTGVASGGARPLAAGESMRLAVAGRGGVPATGVSAVAMTVTATQSAAAGFVQAVPSDDVDAVGTTSTVNLTAPGQTVANLVLVPVGADGTVTLHSSSGTHVLADVVGWFTDTTAPASAHGLFVPLAAHRVLDTRSWAPPAPGSQTGISALGRGGVPSDGVAALLLNPIATGTAGPGYLQVFPARRGTPAASSSVNYTGAGQTVSNAAVGALGTGGVAALYTPTRTHVVVDVLGWFTGPVARVGHVAWAWGDDQYGEIGDGRTADHSPLGPVLTDRIWRDVAAGGSRTLAVGTDGTLWHWGNHYFADFSGQVRPVTVPERVGADADWARVAAGSKHDLALKADGSLWAWGHNDAGQLGDGSSGWRTHPARVGTDADWVAISTSGKSSAALKGDGTLWTWGSNVTGQLGHGTTTDSPAPRQVGQDSDWAAVDLGGNHAVALKTDGSLWAWGWGLEGRLGNGTTTDHRTPQPVAVGSRWTLADAGSSHTVAIRADGTLWTWGGNHFGQLGDGTTAPRGLPQQVAVGTTFVSAGAGTIQSAAVAADGTLWSWGGGSSACVAAQCTSHPIPFPTRVSGETRWARVIAGNQFTVALQW